jgi:hypothetical protein
MGAITPQFLIDLESRMQIAMESSYAGLLSNLWWQNVARVRPSTGRREIVTWLLSTAQIRDQGKGGNVRFDDLVSTYTEYENKVAGAGLKLSKYQLEDTDGGGMDLAGQWSSDIGMQAAYWPQKLATHFLKNGHTLGSAGGYTGYDSVAFFSASHLVNPADPSGSTFANLFTGGASGSYPGALPIDESVSLDVALANLAKLSAYVASIKMPNGEDPRSLRLKGLLVSPRLMPRASQLVGAKFIASTATGGVGGTSDVEAYIRQLGLAQPIQADELAGFESDTTYFPIIEAVGATQLGAAIYSEREAFKVNFYGPQDQVTLGRKKEFEWTCEGRNAIAPGHPFLLAKVKAT